MTRRDVIVAAAIRLLGGCVLHDTAEAAIFSKKCTPDEQRAEIRKMRDQTL